MPQPEPHTFMALMHDAAACELKILGVAEHRLVEHTAIFEGPAHDLGTDHGGIIVGESDGPSSNEAADLGQLSAGPPFGDGAHGEHVGIAGPLRLQIDELRRGLVIQSRLGIRHASNRRNAAREGRCRTRGDGLVFIPARLTQVNVHID